MCDQVLAPRQILGTCWTRFWHCFRILGSCPSKHWFGRVYVGFPMMKVKRRGRYDSDIERSFLIKLEKYATWQWIHDFFTWWWEIRYLDWSVQKGRKQWILMHCKNQEKIVDGNRTTLFEIVFHKGRFGLRKFKAWTKCKESANLRFLKNLWQLGPTILSSHIGYSLLFKKWCLLSFVWITFEPPWRGFEMRQVFVPPLSWG